VKRKALAVILITVIALSIATWFVYNQNSELQNQIRDSLKITEFSSGGWGNPAGMAMSVGFNITIMNAGITEVDGVILEIKRPNFDSDPFNITRTLGILHAGETTEIQDFIIIGMDRYFDEFYHSNFVATLRVGNTIVDERTLEITERQF